MSILQKIHRFIVPFLNLFICSNNSRALQILQNIWISSWFFRSCFDGGLDFGFWELCWVSCRFFTMSFVVSNKILEFLAKFQDYKSKTFLLRFYPSEFLEIPVIYQIMFGFSSFLYYYLWIFSQSSKKILNDYKLKTLLLQFYPSKFLEIPVILQIILGFLSFLYNKFRR